jgi:hypothetical protein
VDLTRTVLIAVAIVAAGWLLLGFRSTILESEGDAAVERATFGGLPPGELAEARRSLRRARRFSVDARPLLTEGRLLYFAGRRAEATTVAERLVALEPENFDAWVLLYTVARGRDPSRATAAFRAVRALNPIAARALR